MGSRTSAILPRLKPKQPPDPSGRHQNSAIAPPSSPGRSPKGHEDAFPPTTLSNRSRLGKPTFAGTRSKEQDAPTADRCGLKRRRQQSTQSRPSWALMVAAAHAPFPVVLAPQSEHLTTALTNDGRGMAEPLPR